MIRLKLNIRQLEVFAAVARGENVSQAARQLALSQSAASNALAELERLYDCLLFDRIGKSLRLNARGHALLPAVEDLLARGREIESRLAGGTLGPLAVGATLTIGNYLATLVVAEYLRRHPESPVNLSVANTSTVIERLLRFRLDLGLIEGEPGHPEVDAEPWLKDSLVVCCAPNHALAGAGKVGAAQLAGQRWILREAGSGTRSVLERALGRHAAHLDVVLALEHTEAIKRAVESGLGIACLSRLALREALRRGSLVEIQTPALDLSRDFLFVWHRQRQPDAAMRAFMALCRQMAGAAATTADLPLPYIP